MSMRDRRISTFSSLASTPAHERLPDALVEWVKGQPGSSKKSVASLEDLKDGVALGLVLLDLWVAFPFSSMKRKWGERRRLSAAYRLL
jgi:hypothetical protein